MKDEAGEPFVGGGTDALTSPLREATGLAARLASPLAAMLSLVSSVKRLDAGTAIGTLPALDAAGLGSGSDFPRKAEKLLRAFFMPLRLPAPPVPVALAAFFAFVSLGVRGAADDIPLVPLLLLPTA